MPSSRAIAFLGLVACHTSHDADSAGGRTGSEAGSNVTAAASAPPCDLDGRYRLRFRSNGDSGWWLRVRVAGTTAALLEPVPMLELATGPLRVTADANACKLALDTHSEHAGEIHIALLVDRTTGWVDGTLTRTRKVEPDDSPAPIIGAHDVGAIQAPACLHPGVFELAIDRKATWQTGGDPPAGLDCRMFGRSPITRRVRIEPLQDQLVIDGVDEHDQLTAIRGKVNRIGPCELVLELFDRFESIPEYRQLLVARLTLHGDTLAGEAASVVQVLNDPQSGDPRWSCTAKRVAVDGKRIPE
jgi:hypothetical protein